MNEYQFIIASLPDKEYCVCEVYYKGELMAEISQETEALLVKIYNSLNSDSWQMPLDDFHSALEYAKEHLLSGEEKS